MAARMLCVALAALMAGPAAAEVLRDQSRGWLLTVDGGGLASECASSLAADARSATMIRCGQTVRIGSTGVEIDFPGEGRTRARRPRCSIELVDSVVKIDGRIVWPFSVEIDRIGQAGRMLDDMRIAQRAGFDEAARNCAAFARDLGEPLALVPYGRMLFDGTGGEADETGALALFEEAARMGMMDGIVMAGIAYSQGRGAEADPARAARYYRRAARAGSRTAARNLVILATRTEFEVMSYADTLDWLDRLDEMGVARVSALRRNAAEVAPDTLLSEMAGGVAVEVLGVPDSEIAVEGEAARLRHAETVAELRPDGVYVDGERVWDAPRRVLRLAHGRLFVDGLRIWPVSIAGDPDAVFEAARQARRDEDGVSARELAQRAIELGHPRAPALLGRMHRTGLGGPVDYDKAIALYEQGIEIGDRDAILRMGFMHGQGLGVPQSDAEALRFYRRAARMGSRVATRNIVEVAIRGGFQVMPYEEAEEWMAVLEEAEDRRAAELRAELDAARAALAQD